MVYDKGCVTNSITKESIKWTIEQGCIAGRKKIIITNRWQKIIQTSKSIGNFCILREKYIRSMYQTVMNSIFDEIKYKKKIFTLEPNWN